MIVELDGVRPIAADVLQTLAESLDGELSRLNVEYAHKRVSRRLAGPRVLRVRTGTFDREREEIVRAKNGSDFQYKHKYLQTDPNYHKRFLPDESPR
jgi:hypothetical protein